jgi:hypothetical protein
LSARTTHGAMKKSGFEIPLLLCSSNRAFKYAFTLISLPHLQENGSKAAPTNDYAMNATYQPHWIIYRGGNQAGWVGFGSGRSGQFNFLEEIGSGQFTYCAFSDR